MSAERQLFIKSNVRIAENIYMLSLAGDDLPAYTAGQFINLTVPGVFLKRPFSVHSYTGGDINIAYEVKGQGTYILSGMTSGSLSATLFLGNGFEIEKHHKRIMLIGGGLGAAPLYSIAELYPEREYFSYLGYSTLKKIVLAEKFASAGEITVTTDDGSFGEKCFVTAAVDADMLRVSPDVIFACGPRPMLAALKKIKTSAPVFVSMEERMGCGIGACLVCTCKTEGGNKRVCKDGPVFPLSEVVL